MTSSFLRMDFLCASAGLRRVASRVRAVFDRPFVCLFVLLQVLQECGVAGTVNKWTGSAVKASIVGSLPEIFNRYSTFTYLETWTPVREGHEVRSATLYP